jgi:hypothetical protein
MVQLASYTVTSGTINLPFLYGDYKSNSYTVLTGQVIPAGTPVGIITASGKIKASASGAGDGSQNPIGITAFAIDTSATGTNDHTIYDVIVEADLVDYGKLYVTGLTWTAETLKTALATRNIHVKTLLSGKGAD